MHNGLAPVRTFLLQFNRYRELIAAYENRYELAFELNKSSRYEETKIRMHLQHIFELQEAVKRDIPDFVSCGKAYVDCTQAKQSLIQLAKATSTALLDQVRDNMLRMCQDLQLSFEEINTRLSKELNSPEDLVEVVRFTEKLDDHIERLTQGLVEVRQKFYLLEDHQYVLSNDETDAFWMANSMPKRTEYRVVKCKSNFKHAKAQFKHLLLKQRVEFRNRVEKCLQAIQISISIKFQCSQADERLQEVLSLQEEMSACLSFGNRLCEHESLFALDGTPLEPVEQGLATINPFVQLWSVVADWSAVQNNCFYGEFIQLNVEEVEKHMHEAEVTSTQLRQVLSDHEQAQNILDELGKMLQEFSPIYPLIKSLHCPGMKDRHWNQVSEILSTPFRPILGMTLSSILDNYNLLEYVEQINQVASHAYKEREIEMNLSDMRQVWHQLAFRIVPYNDTFLLHGAEEILQIIEDHVIQLQVMRATEHVEPFIDDVKSWEQRLHTRTDIIEEWIKCQKRWLYLEAFFSSSEALHGLPREVRKFREIDGNWRRIMESSQTNPKVVACTTNTKLGDYFRDSNRQLDAIVAGLGSFFNSKRASCPRLFFLSNDQVVSLLSSYMQSTEQLEELICKCIPGIKQLKLHTETKPQNSENSTTETNSRWITAVVGSLDENIQLPRHVNTNQPLEKWILELSNFLCNTVKSSVQDSFASISLDSDFVEELTKFPSQVTGLVLLAKWTEEIRRAVWTDTLTKTQHMPSKTDTTENEKPVTTTNVIAEDIPIDSLEPLKSPKKQYEPSASFNAEKSPMLDAFRKHLIQLVQQVQTTTISEELQDDRKEINENSDCEDSPVEGRSSHNKSPISVSTQSIGAPSSSGLSSIGPTFSQNLLEIVRRLDNTIATCRRLLADVYLYQHSSTEALNAQDKKQSHFHAKVNQSSSTAKPMKIAETLIHIQKDAMFSESESESDEECDTEVSIALTRLRLESCLTLFIYLRETTNSMITNQVHDFESWDWLCHLRAEYDPIEALENREGSDWCIQQLTAKLPYKFEYLGPMIRMVITPATERCLISLATAAHYSTVAMIVGGPCQGKLETIRELARVCGTLFIHMPCPGLSLMTALQSLSGIVALGAWGCITHITELLPDVLTVISGQIRTICSSIRARSDQVKLLTMDISLGLKPAIFATASLSLSRGEIQKLPHCLKTFMRPIRIAPIDLSVVLSVVLLRWVITIQE